MAIATMDDIRAALNRWDITTDPDEIDFWQSLKSKAQVHVALVESEIESVIEDDIDDHMSEPKIIEMISSDTNTIWQWIQDDCIVYDPEYNP